MKMKPIRLSIVVLILTTRIFAQADTLIRADTIIQADTLAAGVSQWNKAPVTPTKTGESRSILTGATRDLTSLDIRALTLNAGQSAPQPREAAPQPREAEYSDQLLIVKDGILSLTTVNASKQLGPGGVALFAAGTRPGLKNTGTTPVTYYLFRFISRSSRPIRSSPTEGKGDQARQARSPVMIDWPEMEMKPTNKGETRQIFDRPVSWLGKINLHATTLNPGEVSHPPHTHRAEEIILMRSGHVQEYIDGHYCPASGGDLIFLPSGSLHAVENKSSERCEYFALQWQL
jgi:(S)-ureidoglycine aminohydrolase